MADPAEATTNQMDLPSPPRGSEPARDGGSAFLCSLCDLDQVHKISQLLLPGLAAACVDSTTGDLFRGPASVAVDVRKDMVEFLGRMSESYVAESVLLHAQEGGGAAAPATPDAAAAPAQADPDSEAAAPEDAVEGEQLQPMDIVSDFLEDFAASKRNLLSRVSGWLMSETREDKVDDFVQEMETNGFWLADRRVALAETLLRNLDYDNTYHCGMGFDTAEELAAHRGECRFRPVRCGNEGCNATFCAVHSDKHDSACPFKILLCEQNCGQSIPRREMDRHCITVCTMKLVNCPFYQVGCRTDAFPRCQIERHCSDSLQSHLLYVLQVIHKQDDVTVDELKQRAEQLEKARSFIFRFSLIR
ncbi:hypothetical protein Taro_034757 [Colocasia esculenta]|uniref:TRAF-type domain-containing protein n=1 Tax=Colocasia esculenta TaxID=4460 RepID=A0A843WB14_COLES|nr:hypothetical protein [Colocasia esculenta]